MTTGGVTSASSGSLVYPEPRSATQSPALSLKGESNHLLEFELKCGNTRTYLGSTMVTKLEG